MQSHSSGTAADITSWQTTCVLSGGTPCLHSCSCLTDGHRYCACLLFLGGVQFSGYNRVVYVQGAAVLVEMKLGTVNPRLVVRFWVVSCKRSYYNSSLLWVKIALLLVAWLRSFLASEKIVASSNFGEFSRFESSVLYRQKIFLAKISFLSFKTSKPFKMCPSNWSSEKKLQIVVKILVWEEAKKGVKMCSHWEIRRRAKEIEQVFVIKPQWIESEKMKKQSSNY